MEEKRLNGERTVSYLGRRQFLMGAAASAAAVAVAAACSSDDSAQGVRTASTSTPPPTFDSPPFTLGVASGDPDAGSVILWTRLAPDPTAADGSGGMGTDPVEVVWELSADETFADLVGSGVAIAEPEHAHCVHVEAADLKPGTRYWYRFRVGETQSPVGQTKTLAAGSPEQFSLAVVNCQMYEVGAYGAYRHLLDEDVDLVVHLGDYIYEYPSDPNAMRQAKPDHLVETLADYRVRYGAYKQDPDLAATHARYPFVASWDDHEVANNYMGDSRPDGADPDVVAAQKAAAYQAWWENMPTRMAAPSDDSLDIYQALDIGDLARFHLLDQRQYSDVPPCRDSPSAAGDFGNCDEVTDDRTRLGSKQEAWLEESLATSTATWNLLGNPVVLAGVNAGGETDAYYLDTWDGYPQARARLIDQLAQVDNPVVLTGDYHAAMVLDVHQTPFSPDTPVVAPEFMAPPISSGLFDADVSARTPQLRQQINAHGYMTVMVTPDTLTATMRTLDDVTDVETAISTAATWQVTAGDPKAHEV